MYFEGSKRDAFARDQSRLLVPDAALSEKALDGADRSDVERFDTKVTRQHG